MEGHDTKKRGQSPLTFQGPFFFSFTFILHYPHSDLTHPTFPSSSPSPATHSLHLFPSFHSTPLPHHHRATLPLTGFNHHFVASHSSPCNTTIQLPSPLLTFIPKIPSPSSSATTLDPRDATPIPLSLTDHQAFPFHPNLVAPP
ncbi:unnamed protein product [Sphenostylis stenocarpa]|uniref:Uncharacterized protein n=1 Tax=Sphenostylis stenocarpa TaxID=92480 RepID=A0AA86VL49_9FABA|nr:unnamed protein product [Sphenostylis stenocarpa]